MEELQGYENSHFFPNLMVLEAFSKLGGSTREKFPILKCSEIGNAAFSSFPAHPSWNFNYMEFFFPFLRKRGLGHLWGFHHSKVKVKEEKVDFFFSPPKFPNSRCFAAVVGAMQHQIRDGRDTEQFPLPKLMP